MKRVLSFILATMLITTNIGHAEAFNAVIMGDLETGDLASNQNGAEEIAIASTTKLMTYLVVMDQIRAGKGKLEEKIKIDSEAVTVGGSTFSLKAGEEVEIETLLEAILIVSGNDACIALAKHFGESEAGFVKLMNEKAKELGLKNTVYYTPNGLPDPENRENTMTAEELFKLTAHILKKYPEITEITEKKQLIVENRNFIGENTNPLLDRVPGVDGLKTGFTNQAGRCLVATGVQADKNRVIGVFMGALSDEIRAEASGAEMKLLLENYEKRRLYSKADLVSEEAISGSKYKKLALYPVEDVEVFMDKSEQNIKKEIVVNSDIETPIEPGDVVGKLKLDYGIVEKELDLTVNERISGFKLFRIGVANFFKSTFQ